MSKHIHLYAPSLLIGFLCAFTFISDVTAQGTTHPDILHPPKYGHICRAQVSNGDTVPYVFLETVNICAGFIFHSPGQYEQWTRVKFNVKKVYPYAIIAAARLKEFDIKLLTIQNQKQKSAYIKRCEQELRDEFEEELKALSVSQGKILMKLINRETGKTPYEVVKQMRGGFQASMWQGLARIFGHNLKSGYDSRVEDIMIERAVKLVETGRF